MTLKVTLVAITPTDHGDVNDPKHPYNPKTLLSIEESLRANVKAIVDHASKHPYDDERDDHPGNDPLGRFTLKTGTVECAYYRIRLDKKLLAILDITTTNAREIADLPPPFACTVFARMFGFRGELGHDYLASPNKCACKPPCRPRVVCMQELLS